MNGSTILYMAVRRAKTYLANTGPDFPFTVDREYIESVVRSICKEQGESLETLDEAVRLARGKKRH